MEKVLSSIIGPNPDTARFSYPIRAECNGPDNGAHAPELRTGVSRRPPSRFGTVVSARQQCFRLSEELQVSMKVELAIMKGTLERFVELAAKDATEHLDGKKESIAWLAPTRAIGSESTGRHHAMHMRVKFEFLIQVCNTLKKPISAPRCLGSRATSRSVLHWFGTGDRRRPSYSGEPVGLTGEVV
jgi:hypothetical protein